MAEARRATVDREVLRTETARVIRLRLVGDEELGFVGGQYVIAHTGVPIAGGKTAKRAYSILSPDADQRSFTLAISRLEGGPGSNHLHALPVGAELAFSGPWGKWRRDSATSGKVFLLVTDTAITAALGWVRGRPRVDLESIRLVWAAGADESFLPDAFVRELLPPDVHYRRALLPPLHHPERSAALAAIADSELASAHPDHAFLAGDGAILPASVHFLAARGVPRDRIFVENFFHAPKKSAGAGS